MLDRAPDEVPRGSDRDLVGFFGTRLEDDPIRALVPKALSLGVHAAVEADIPAVANRQGERGRATGFDSGGLEVNVGVPKRHGRQGPARLR